MKLGLLDGLIAELGVNGCKYVVYDGTIPDPTIENVEAALTLYHENDCKAIIAFGGGSPIDCAKTVGARVARPGMPVEKLKGVLKVIFKIPTLIAVPTTAGTGSEVTLAAVISNSETHEKYPINGFCLIPHYAVLDPELTLKLPPHITAPTGMDAMRHAVEAYIGRSNTRETRQAALDALALIHGNLLQAYENPGDLKARAGDAQSFLSGRCRLHRKPMWATFTPSRTRSAVFTGYPTVWPTPSSCRMFWSIMEVPRKTGLPSSRITSALELEPGLPRRSSNSSSPTFGIEMKRWGFPGTSIRSWMAMFRK